MNLPRIDWSRFLESAPYFNSALIETVEPELAPELAPLPRAAWYWDLFNGEVSNGGVAQYFYNHGLSLPGFERVPEFLAAHPQLSEALPFVRAAHAAWDEVADRVVQAQEQGDWPEELFAALAPRFEQLQSAFFACNHRIACRVHGAIATAPQDYFYIEPVVGVPARGVAHVLLGDGLHRLRFKDGFPVGPNLLENGQGDCDVVWFDDARQLVETHRLGYGSPMRQWLHFPSLASAELGFDQGGLNRYETRLALWERHGLRETLDEAGRVELTQLHLHGRSLLSEYRHPNGIVSLRIEPEPDGERCTRYWPSGALNVEYLRNDVGDLSRCLSCLDEDGRDLAPGGNGRWYELIDQSEGARLWLEGALVEGRLEGDLLRLRRSPDDGSVRELERTRYRGGVPCDE